MWSHSDWFAPVPKTRRHGVIAEAEALIDACRIDLHPFFAHASSSRQALSTWVTQELVVTGPFSQLLLEVAAKIRNVHVRAMVVEVAYGEHGRPGPFLAASAHPWLLDQLRESIGVDTADVVVLPETEKFVSDLRQSCESSLVMALGSLGVGNEKLLIPEYGAIKNAFGSAWPECEYLRFLDANIDEDTFHAALMAKAAGALIADGADPAEYLHGARTAVASRLAYYDNLLDRCKNEH